MNVRRDAIAKEADALFFVLFLPLNVLLQEGTEGYVGHALVLMD